MKANIYNQLRKLSLGVFSLMLLSCSESPSDEMNRLPENLQVVTNSEVIRADASAGNGDIIGVRDELIIGNADVMDVQYPETRSMSAYVNPLIPAVGTKTFVKTTIRKVTLTANNNQVETLTGWPIDLNRAITNMVESLRDRIRNNQSVSIIVEVWFEPMSDTDFFDLYKDSPYSSFFSGK